MLRGGDKNPFTSLFKRGKPDPPGVAIRSSSVPPASAIAPAAPTIAPPSVSPPPPVPTAATGKQEYTDALRALDADLLTLLNMTGSTLLRAMRSPARGISLPGRSGMGQAAAAAAVASALSGIEHITGNGTRASDSTASGGPFTKGLELAGAIEQKARGLLLENSLTVEQSDRLSRITQTVQDLYVALRASRYAWQICLLLGPLDEGIGICARLKRITETLVGLNNEAAQALEGLDDTRAAHAIAVEYRAFRLTVTQNELLLRNAGLSPVGHRLAIAALHSLSVCGECMAKVGARFTLPVAESARRPSPTSLSAMEHDPLLSPVPKR
jgi:hypothetical protein